VKNLISLATAFIVAIPALVMAQVAQDKLDCNGCIASKEIANGSIKGRDIGKNQIGPSKLAKPSGVANAFTEGGTPISGTAVTKQTLDVKLKAAGHLYVNATYSMLVGANEIVKCAITLDSTAFSDTFSARSAFQFSVPTSATDAFRDASAITAVFTDVSKGDHTLRLVCITEAGVTTIDRISLSALYVAGKI